MYFYVLIHHFLYFISQWYPVFLTSILDYFQWKHVAILYDIEDVFFRIQGQALIQALRNDDTYPRPFDLEYDSKKDPPFDDMLEEASKHARGKCYRKRKGLHVYSQTMEAFDL